MKLTVTNIKKLTAALDIQRYRRNLERKFPDLPYASLVDKFFANKPVTLPEMNQVCESEESLWAYIDSLLQIFPIHAALALEGNRNGQTLANGMVLAHTVTKATVFLPLDTFCFVFAVLARHVDEGGVSFAQVTRTPADAACIHERWDAIFAEWIADVVLSKDRTLDLAMHTAGERLVAIASWRAKTAVQQASMSLDDVVRIAIHLLQGKQSLVTDTRKKQRATAAVPAAYPG